MFWARKSLGRDSVRCYKTSIACQKGAKPNDERAHGCGMGCLPKFFGPANFSVAILCVAMKKPIASQKGAKPNDGRAHGCGMDCLPKIFGPENFSVATLCVAMKNDRLPKGGHAER